MAILFISGVNDLSTVDVQVEPSGKIYPILGGNCSILGRVPLRAEIPGFQILFGKGVRQAKVSFATPPSLIVNQVSDADTHRGSLERCIELLQHVKVPVLNHPDRILQTRRDEVSDALQGIDGVVMPRTIRAQPDSPESVLQLARDNGVALPFIVRIAENFEGARKIRVREEGELARLDAFPFDGRDFYVTEYFDCSNDAGLFQAQRIAVIDGEPVMCRALLNDNWDVGEDSRRFMLTQESWKDDETRLRWFETDILPSLAEPISEITRRLKLEYYCIDCNVRPDGEMVVFEASAKPDALAVRHAQENKRLQIIQKKIQAMLARHSGEVVI